MRRVGDVGVAVVGRACHVGRHPDGADEDLHRRAGVDHRRPPPHVLVGHGVKIVAPTDLDVVVALHGGLGRRLEFEGFSRQLSQVFSLGGEGFAATTGALLEGTIGKHFKLFGDGGVERVQAMKNAAA